MSVLIVGVGIVSGFYEVRLAPNRAQRSPRGRVTGPSKETAMPNINRPSRKHETNFRTRDGDLWLPLTDETQITLMISAFMEINRKVIWGAS